MQIIGFNLTKILSEKKEHQEGKLEIKQNINIEDISKDEITITKQEVLKIKFIYGVNYSPDFAKIEIHGTILLLLDDEQLKEALKSWKKKEFSEKFRAPLFNFIMNKCNVRALQLEDELNIPIHLPMPRISPQKQE